MEAAHGMDTLHFWGKRRRIVDHINTSEQLAMKWLCGLRGRCLRLYSLYMSERARLSFWVHGLSKYLRTDELKTSDPIYVVSVLRSGLFPPLSHMLLLSLDPSGSLSLPLSFLKKRSQLFFCNTTLKNLTLSPKRVADQLTLCNTCY